MALTNTILAMMARSKAMTESIARRVCGSYWGTKYRGLLPVVTKATTGRVMVAFKRTAAQQQALVVCHTATLDLVAVGKSAWGTKSTDQVLQAQGRWSKGWWRTSPWFMNRTVFTIQTHMNLHMDCLRDVLSCSRNAPAAHASALK